ncbi:MAG: LEVG family PEP-CTERM protein [Rivularia sp. (in: cyanobacteria)]
MRKFNVIAAVLGLGLGFAAAAPAAHAQNLDVNLIPQEEGEIQLTNLQTLDPNQTINTNPFGFSVTSLLFDEAGTGEIDYGLSRLFVDNAATENDYGDGLIKFSAGKDAGTNTASGEYWLRAAAIQTDGTASENGELEVGRFLFEFERELEEITIDFFDVESLGSGILEVNGQSVTEFILQSQQYDDGKTVDGGTQSLTLTNVNSLVLQLGKHNDKFTKDENGNYVKRNGKFIKDENGNYKASGDGVTISGLEVVKSVPEPTTTFSLGALAVAGMFGVKKRKNLKK